ncbi:MAG: tetratricopeptide repeat protein, partial [Bacteroidota bacterium]
MREEENPFEGFGHIDTLRQRFEQMLQKNDSYFYDVEDFENLIDYYISRSNKKLTEMAIREALEQHPNHNGFILKKAQYYISIDKYDEALTLLNQLEKIDPYNIEIFFIKGGLYSQLNKFNKAIEQYKKALNEENAAEVYTNIAYEYENMGKYKKAIDYLKEALHSDPEDYGLLYELSFCYEITGEMQQGIRFFKQFINENPFSKEAWYNIGMLYSAAGEYENAIEAYDYSLAIDETFLSVILS